jgi:hypothetical protein
MNADKRRSAKLSQRAVAAIELMLRGMSNMDRIAAAVGLSIDEVKRLEAANDPRVRQIIAEGPPPGFVFRLRSVIICPGCGCRIFLVPCMTCRTMRSKAPRSTIGLADTRSSSDDQKLCGL